MEKIYKYVRFEDALKIIDNNSVKLNNPNNYNDPFDSTVEIKKIDVQKSYNLILEFYFFYTFVILLYNNQIEHPTKKKIRIALSRIIYKLYIRMIIKRGYYPNPLLKYMVRKSLKRLNTEQQNNINEKKKTFINSVSNVLKEVKDSIYVSCFSKRNDSILMWSHYADKHKGVCFEFDRPSNDFYDVRYSKKRNTFNLYYITSIVLGQILKNYQNRKIKFDYKNFLSDNDVMFKKVMNPFLVKSLDWEYEDEVRCVLYNKEDNDKIIKIDNELILYEMPKKFTKVYLGCNISLENETQIREALAKINVPVVKLKVSNYEFKLEET